jgi:hypothetical protein
LLWLLVDELRSSAIKPQKLPDSPARRWFALLRAVVLRSGIENVSNGFPKRYARDVVHLVVNACPDFLKKS